MTNRESSADWSACRALLRKESPGLYFGSLSLPPRVRRPAVVVYAFAASLAKTSREATPVAMADIRARVDAVVAGANAAKGPTDRAMASVVRDFAIPRALLDALVEAFSWDASGRRYATLSGLLDYCTRVSAAPGMALCLLMGVRKRSVLERSCDLSIAIQLTRVVRDVGAHARVGRVYLPLEWLEEAGLDVDSWLSAPRPSPPILDVIRRVRKTADSFFLRADPGIAALPFDCRPAVRASRYIYSGILSEIEQRGYDTVSRGARLSLPHKLRLTARALRASRSETRPLDERSDPSFAGLVDAVAIN
ncbi:MAG: phytoene/squalene synthase family protein [Myxococcales bacterium]|nr:phytoene/squalene synthase family protein [Myxococcales bacterium]